MHVAEYARLAPGWKEAARLAALCGDLQAGHWRWPWGGPKGMGPP